jgi:FkbM family methyltransferase
LLTAFRRSAPFAITRFVVRDLPPRRRGLRLATFTHRHFPVPTRLLDARLWCGCRVQVDLHDAIQSSLYYQGLYEPETTAILRRELRPGDCFVDVGSNVGYYALTAACLVGPTGRVHAVEPSGRLGARLAGDIERNRMSARVMLHRCAVADFVGQAHLQRGSHDPTPDGDRFLSMNASGADSEQVAVTTLDELLADVFAVDVMKVDVEGSEMAVFRGGTQLLRRCRPRLLLVEAQEETMARTSGTTPADLFALLGLYGYQGTPYDSPYHAPMVAFRPEA